MMFPPTATWTRAVGLRGQTLAAKADPTYQRDVEARDIAFAQEDARRPFSGGFIGDTELSRAVEKDLENLD